MAGSQGPSLDGVSGGTGQTLILEKRLQAGTVLTVSVPTGIPQDATLSCGGTLVLKANHGGAPILHYHAVTGCTKKHVCDYMCTTAQPCGGRLVLTSTHNYADGCDWHDWNDETGWHYACEVCEEGSAGLSHSNPVPHDYNPPSVYPDPCTHRVVRCRHHLNTWACGLTDGQLMSYETVPSPYMASGWNASVSESNMGNARFSISLSDQSTFAYNSKLLQRFYYVDKTPVKLCVRDDIVLFYRRD